MIEVVPKNEYPLVEDIMLVTVSLLTLPFDWRKFVIVNDLTISMFI